MRMRSCGTAILSALLLATSAIAADDTSSELYWDAGQTLPPLRLELPDSGPRLVDGSETASIPTFARALDAYRRHDLKGAEQGFRATLAHIGEGPIAESARAYLAETILALDSSPPKRLQAIEVYRTLVMQAPDSPNAVRAIWRQGDLYISLGMFVEAKALYERAAGSAPTQWDRDRALLGLGYGYVKYGKWQDAAAVFQTLRRSDGSFGYWSSIGLAECLYTLKRFGEARSMYEMSYRFWPELFKSRPTLLLKYADTAWLEHHPGAARRLYAEIHNVHPKRPEAGIALIRIGDTLRDAGLWSRASMFYADAAASFTHGSAGAVARMRLAQLGHTMGLVVQSRPGGVAALMTWQPLSFSTFGPSMPPVEERAQRAVFDEIADRYDRSILGSEARFHLGELAESRHDDLEAARIYDDLVQRTDRFEDDPWPERALQRLAVVMTPWIERALRRGDDLTAVALYRESKGRSQESLAATALILPLADAHRRLGHTTEAVKLYQTLLADRRSRFEEDALIGLGWSYIAQEDLGAAKHIFERYRLQHPVGRWTSEAIRATASILERQDDKPGAIRTYRHWLQVFSSPTHADRGTVLVALARLLAESGDLQEAIRLYDQAERTEAGQQAEALIQHADVLARLERLEPAARLYARGARAAKDPEVADWAQLQLSRIRRLQKRYADAGDALDELGQQTVDELMSRLALAMKADLPEED
ncbi:MAG TPA: tetratricopeptide repeat protein [Nitrospirales bacterium]|nr:tetratricopeptide repeat protein [Nitrospirales bacterium]